MATATCTAFHGVLEGTGEWVGQRALLERVGFLAQLSRELTGVLVAARWDEDSLDVLSAGLDERGEGLPSKGWMAMRRLNWPQTLTPPAGVYVPDRVRRGAEEYAARTLRLALHRRSIVAAVLAAWPADPSRRTDAEWTALRALLPAQVSGAEIRNRTRQIRRFMAGHGRLPAGLCAVEGPPQVAPQVLLAAMDRQQVTLARVDAATARLRVRLPLRAAPATGRDWAWHVIDIRLPGTIAPDALLHTPTLRPTPSGRIAVDLPHSRPAPATRASGHQVALGFDWGVNTLLTGVLGRLTGRGPTRRVVTDGRPLIFDATVISAALHRLRGVREHLAVKRERCQALADGLGSPHLAWGEHLDRAQMLEAGHRRVCARIRRLNTALAWAAARWAVDQAVALGASVIYLEDLATLEARGHRKANARLSGQVRGTVAEATAPPGREGPDRGGHRPGPGHLQAVPRLPRQPHSPPGPRPAGRAGLEVGALRGLPPVDGPGSRRRPPDHLPRPARPGPHHHRTRHRRPEYPHHRGGHGGFGPPPEESHPPPAPTAPRGDGPAPAARAQGHPGQGAPHPQQAERHPAPRCPARRRTASPGLTHFPPYARCAYGPRHRPRLGSSPASGGA
ncbi:hypothetical protein OTB16_30025 [Streptomyces sp. H27-S2]|nr:hypothetical protein [Streptomyces sp. H27-S2]MCY0953628.1 hypothetical protein [Streptomyces sp. H27-S2]